MASNKQKIVEGILYPEDVREKLQGESTIGGYKDKVVGQVKERVGHLFHNDRLEKSGLEQRLKGEQVLGSGHKASPAGEVQKKEPSVDESKRSAQLIDTFIRREALMAEINRIGGFERFKSHLRPVEARERDVRDLFKVGEGSSVFTLRKWNKQALLEDIRSCNTRKPLVSVQTQEKGLLRSNKIDNFKLRKTEFVAPLWADIKRGDGLLRLRKLNADQRRDRSAPRLDFFRNLAALSEKRESLLKEIGQADQSSLKHVKTDDRTKPEMFFDKSTTVHRFPRARLLDEVHEGAKLKHVQTNDKSTPSISGDVQVRTWDRQGFLDEVQSRTMLKQF